MKKLPKNLKLKIGSKKEAAWTRIKETSEDQILQYEISTLIDKAIIELAEEQLAKEKDL